MDITMCTNKKCELKDCYRKTATPSYWQSYCEFDFKKKDGKTICEWYFKR